MTMYKNNKWIFALSALLILGYLWSVGCRKIPDYTPPQYTSTTIQEVWLDKFGANTNLSKHYPAMLTGDTIMIVLPYGSNVTSLEPTFYLSCDSITPKGAQNFSSPVKYTIWANGKSKTYTFIINVSTIQNPKFIDIKSGFSSLIALRDDGTLWACGNNEFGHFGLNDNSSRNNLVQLPMYNVTKFYTGDPATIVYLNDGTAWATGNFYGELGLGNTIGSTTFSRTPQFDNANNILILLSGDIYILKSDGTIWGCGKNMYKTLLQADNMAKTKFVQLPIDNVEQVSGWYTSFIAKKTNGEIYVWGENMVGQLGTGDTLNYFTPKKIINPIIAVKKLFVGANSSFIIDNSNKLWCSGYGIFGQLGLGDNLKRKIFTNLSFFNSLSIEQILPSSVSTYFRETNGNVWSVGSNVAGQLGYGTTSTSPSLTPKLIPSLTATKIAGYGNTVYALKADGTIWSWGQNSAGALGISSDIELISTPTQLKYEN